MASRVLRGGGPPHEAVHAAVRRLTHEASRRWMHHEHLVDDITVIILLLDEAKLANGTVAQAV